MLHGLHLRAMDVSESTGTEAAVEETLVIETTAEDM